MTRDSQGMGPERGGTGGGEVDFEGGLWWFRLFGEELYLGVGVSDGVGGNSGGSLPSRCVLCWQA